MKAKLAVLAVGLVAVQMTSSAQTGQGSAPNLGITGVDPNQYRYADFEKLHMQDRAGDHLSGGVTDGGQPSLGTHTGYCDM